MAFMPRLRFLLPSVKFASTFFLDCVAYYLQRCRPGETHAASSAETLIVIANFTYFTTKSSAGMPENDRKLANGECNTR